MSEFIFAQISFYFAIFFVLFLPGLSLILATRLYKQFDSLVLFILSFASSIVSIDFLMILLGRTPLGITKVSMFAGIFLFASICAAIYLKYAKNNKQKFTFWREIPESPISKRSLLIILLILLLTIFIKTFYFKDAIFPTATDLGHHMYWTKVITTTGQLPEYAKSDIGADYTIGSPSPIADFIIGEHLIFAAVSLISGANPRSSFPILLLFLVHIFSILAIFALAKALFKNSPNANAISLITLFLIGPLYALSSPQAKFISGGVIGNDIGNFLIPVLVLLFLKAFSEKKSAILSYALFLSLGLAYTHHLSTFVFIFLAIFTVFSYALINYKTITLDFKQWMGLASTKEVLLIILTGLVFIFLYTPTYLNGHAINTAVGAPSKASRAGLTLTQLKDTAGEARFAFALLGIFLLLFAKKIGRYQQAFLFGWAIALTLMSLRPDWLFVDIPSNRIASYIVYPSAIIAAYVFILFWNFLKSTKTQSFFSPFFILSIFFVFVIFISTSGFYDNSVSLNSDSSTKEALQTYAASSYLAKFISNNDVVLKDHNYLAGDSWIKLFFMRDYNFPLSRGYFKRYEDTTKSREQCTNFMITEPNNTEAQKCFTGTRTNFLMINPQLDSAQFQRMKEFWQVYSSDAVGVFYKAK